MEVNADVYLLTPGICNLYCDDYATNEDNMIDWEGNMIDKRDRNQIIIYDLHAYITLL